MAVRARSERRRRERGSRTKDPWWGGAVRGPPGGDILGRVSTETAQLFFSLLTVVAGLGAIGLVVLAVLARSGNEPAAVLGRGQDARPVEVAFAYGGEALFTPLVYAHVLEVQHGNPPGQLTQPGLG